MDDIDDDGGRRSVEFDMDFDDDELDLLVSRGILRPRVVYELTRHGLETIFKESFERND